MFAIVFAINFADFAFLQKLIVAILVKYKVLYKSILYLTICNNCCKFAIFALYFCKIASNFCKNCTPAGRLGLEGGGSKGQGIKEPI